jgi:hypothetical protein
MAAQFPCSERAHHLLFIVGKVVEACGALTQVIPIPNP